MALWRSRFKGWRKVRMAQGYLTEERQRPNKKEVVPGPRKVLGDAQGIYRQLTSWIPPPSQAEWDTC